MTDLHDWLQPIDRSVRQSGMTRAVVLSRHYETTTDDLWDAWTDVNRLRRWLGSISGEPREGGEIVLDMGDDRPATCTILRCDPPRRLVADWHFPGDGDSTVELRLTPEGDRTLLELEHVGLDEVELARDYGEGWEDFLHRLGQYLRDAEPTSVPWTEVREVLDPFWQPLVHAPEIDARWPSVERQADDANIHVRRFFPAAPDDVWDALTDPDRLAAWFGTVEIGDTWTVRFPDGPGTASGTIERCEPGRELITSWKWAHEETGSLVHLTLEPVAGGTVLRLDERAAPSPFAHSYAAGWYAKLAGLALHLAGTDPTEADWDADFSLAGRTVEPLSGAGH